MWKIITNSKRSVSLPLSPSLVLPCEEPLWHLICLLRRSKSAAVVGKRRFVFEANSDADEEEKQEVVPKNVLSKSVLNASMKAKVPLIAASGRTQKSSLCDPRGSHWRNNFVLKLCGVPRQIYSDKLHRRWTDTQSDLYRNYIAIVHIGGWMHRIIVILLMYMYITEGRKILIYRLLVGHFISQDRFCSVDRFRTSTKPVNQWVM